jgi:hypothetical protein
MFVALGVQCPQESVYQAEGTLRAKLEGTVLACVVPQAQGWVLIRHACPLRLQNKHA